MLWVLKGSFEHPKHTFQLMDKKISTFYAQLFSLYGPSYDHIQKFTYMCLVNLTRRLHIYYLGIIHQPVISLALFLPSIRN